MVPCKRGSDFKGGMKGRFWHHKAVLPKWCVIVLIFDSLLLTLTGWSESRCVDRCIPGNCNGGRSHCCGHFWNYANRRRKESLGDQRQLRKTQLFWVRFCQILCYISHLELVTHVIGFAHERGRAWSSCILGSLKQQPRQRQRKCHLIINIWEMSTSTILWLLLLPRILYCWHAANGLVETK